MSVKHFTNSNDIGIGSQRIQENTTHCYQNDGIQNAGCIAIVVADRLYCWVLLLVVDVIWMEMMSVGGRCCLAWQKGGQKRQRHKQCLPTSRLLSRCSRLSMAHVVGASTAALFHHGRSLPFNVLLAVCRHHDLRIRTNVCSRHTPLFWLAPRSLA